MAGGALAPTPWNYRDNPYEYMANIDDFTGADHIDVVDLLGDNQCTGIVATVASVLYLELRGRSGFYKTRIAGGVLYPFNITRIAVANTTDGTAAPTGTNVEITVFG